MRRGRVINFPVFFTIRLSAAMYEAARRTAREREMSLAQLCRDAMRAEFKRSGVRIHPLRAAAKPRKQTAMLPQAEVVKPTVDIEAELARLEARRRRLDAENRRGAASPRAQAEQRCAEDDHTTVL
jgi:hypothetical protein